ncbi:hypothetical protein GDO86_020033 [Hymenochirus boettgeri]|uniref:G-protein coupled receptors family 1 profile domain-containing protein n=1 Tax=Hymenochirus boettgeri TaxID=247094 RepID=A0A8T2IJ27_9PIPI|nr:hypothetical protein GDO86_020033 [Hymenochirus boettgeri]
MRKTNQTLITEFYLLGFGNLHSYKYLFFSIFLITYFIMLTGNILVIILVVCNKTLHFPMYFFLTQLSLCEIVFTTNIVPNMLRIILGNGGTMSVTACLGQLYLSCVPSITQCLILATMSFDRHIAICNPLRYMSIMTFRKQLHIVISCWASGLMVSILTFAFVNELQFCKSNIINHIYCDITPIIELSCSDTFSVELILSLASVFAILVPLLFIILTYISIIVTILKIPSRSGRQKTFSTCSSHLSVVCMYYGTMVSLYIYPPGKHYLNVNKILSLLYVVVTPLFNPVIYSLRNQDFRRAIFQTLQSSKQKLCFKEN